jgi:hypothetical protein
MKIIGLILFALALTTISTASAASDAEILQFARGVLAGDSQQSTAAIDGDTLTIIGKLNEYSDADTSTVGFALWEMSLAADKIVKAYPNQFRSVSLGLYDSSGKNNVGLMIITLR